MTELLDKQHHREGFDCGKELLNSYLKFQAGQDVRRKLSACFVLCDKDSKIIHGYYTLCSHSISLHLLPDGIRKKLPPAYTAVPVILLGRLAIDKRQQGRGLGKILLIDALKRSYDISQELGSFAVVVDPLDEAAENFYRNYDFITLPDSGKMFIAMKTLQHLFAV